MGFGSGQASAELALFPWLRAAGGTTNRQRFFLCDFHFCTMRGCAPTNWSIVTIARSYPRRIISVERVQAGAGKCGPMAVSSLRTFSQERSHVQSTDYERK